MIDRDLAIDAIAGAPLGDARILIVDDEQANVDLLTEILTRGRMTDIVSTTDPRLVPHLFRERQPDVVLLDLRMPHIDGFELLRELRGLIDPADFVPMVVLTAETSADAKRRALALGANDFITKPFDVTEVLLRIENVVRTRFLHRGLARQNLILEDQVRERTANLWEAVQRLTESEKETREATEEMIRRLAAAAEYRDEETGAHIERMARYAALLATRVGIDRERADVIRLAASMHDIGKIAVPDRILRKVGKLTEEEMREMRTHAEVGHRILNGSAAEVVQLAATIALTHHERFDGTGYPRGVSGQAIPIEGRIAAIADVFDALTSNRVYRNSMPVGQAVDLMRGESGKHFDPDLLDVFVDALPDVLVISEAYSDEARPPRV